MSNFKSGDEVICIRAYVAFGLVENERYILTDVQHCSCGAISASFGSKTGLLTTHLTCCGCGELITTNCLNEWYCNAEKRFRKAEPRHEHSTRSIKNLSVVKELSRLPLVKETTEVPVRKQEGVEV